MKMKKMLSLLVTVGIATSCVTGLSAVVLADDEIGQDIVQQEEEEAAPIVIAADAQFTVGDTVTFAEGTTVQQSITYSNRTWNTTNYTFDSETTLTVASISRSSSQYGSQQQWGGNRYYIYTVYFEDSDLTLAFRNSTNYSTDSVGLVVSGSGTSGSPFVLNAVRNGWYTSSGWGGSSSTYYYIFGTAVTGFYEIDEDTYYFNDSGVLQKNKIVTVEDDLYAVDANGVMVVSEFFMTRDGTYYLQEDGKAIVSDWLVDENEMSHYFGEDGLMLVDTAAKIEDSIYVFDFDGVMRTSGFFSLSNGDTYYLQDDGTAKVSRWQSYRSYWYYLDENGIRVEDAAKKIGNDIYVFDQSGRMQKGGLVWVGDDVYYLNLDGTAFINDWAKVDGKWYYFGEDGIRIEDEVMEIDGSIYVFDEMGVMQNSGWYGDYYLQPNGSAKVNRWQADAETDAWYYLGEDGAKVTGLQTINDKLYIFDDEGIMLSDGFYEALDEEENWNVYYLLEDGSAVVGSWKKIDGDWYYFGDDGAMYYDDVAEIDGKLYIFDEAGVMQSNGWCGDYYLQYDGSAKVNRWQSFGSYWYYLGEDGVTVKDQTKEINGALYVFDYSGIMLKGGLVECQGDQYYLLLDGTAVVSDWMTIDGEQYYFDEEGKMVYGLQEIDGKIYFFDYAGVMQVDGWYEVVVDEEDVEMIYLQADGTAKVNRWQADAETGAWYYLGADGFMVTDEALTIGGTTYVFGEDGAMVTGDVYEIDGDCYWLQDNGAAYTNRFRSVGDDLYYFGADGKMVKSQTLEIEGTSYTFDAEGKCTNAPVEIGGLVEEEEPV